MNRYLRAAQSAIGIRRFVVASVIGAVISAYGAIREFFPRLPELPSWQLGVFVFLVIIAWWFLVRVAELEESIVPRLEIRYLDQHPFQTTDPYRSSGSEGASTRLFRVEVRNIGATSLEGCLVKLDDLRATDGREFVAGYVPIALRTQHQAGEGRPGGRFDLRPDEFKLVEVASLDETVLNSEIAMRYETTQYTPLIPRGHYELVLGAYGSPTPTRRRFRMWVEAGRLRLEALGERNAA